MRLFIICCIIAFCPLYADVTINSGSIEVNNGASLQISGNLTVGSYGTFVSTNRKGCSALTAFTGTEGSSDGVDITPTGDMGTTSVTHYSGSFHSQANIGVKSWWIINPTTTRTMTVTFRFRTQDLNSLSLTDLSIFEWNGSQWLKHTEALYSTSGSSGNFSYVTFTGLILTETKANHDLALGSASAETLPVELSSFTTLNSTNNSVLLKWITQSETNMLGYHLYRNTSSLLTDAERISDNIIQATNTSNQKIYEYQDLTSSPSTLYYYWLQSIEMNGITNYSGPISITTNDFINEIPVIPLKDCINSIYPNPFNPSTTIDFEISNPQFVDLSVYNIKGELVSRLLHQNMNKGKHKIIWEGKDQNQKKCSTGIYFCKLSFGTKTLLRKMIILK